MTSDPDLPSTTLWQVKVKPRARASLLQETSPGVWLAHLKAPPVDGKANEELRALVAKHWGCAKSAVSIKGGATGRMKWVQIVHGSGGRQR